MENLLAVALGGLVASIVPLATLFRDQLRWKKEKKIENLRFKLTRLERIYAEVLEQLGEAFKTHSYPSNMTSKISAYGSKEVRDLLFGYLLDKDRDRRKVNNLYLDICLAAHKHLASIEDKIEKELS